MPSPQGHVLGASARPRIIERIIQTSAPLSIVSPADLAALEARLNLRIDNIVTPPPFPQQIAANGTGIVFTTPPISERIDQLNNVTLNNPTIIGGSLSGTTGAGGGGIGDDATTTTFFST
jgi:hypothetical protein